MRHMELSHIRLESWLREASASILQDHTHHGQTTYRKAMLGFCSGAISGTSSTVTDCKPMGWLSVRLGVTVRCKWFMSGTKSAYAGLCKGNENSLLHSARFERNCRGYCDGGPRMFSLWLSEARYLVEGHLVPEQAS